MSLDTIIINRRHISEFPNGLTIQGVPVNAGMESHNSLSNLQGGDTNHRYHLGLLKHDGTVAPNANNDSTEDYSVGSRWIDITADKEYVCLDASTGAAVWIETTQSGGGGNHNSLSGLQGGDSHDNYYHTPKNELSASHTPPGVFADVNAGYDYGSKWLDVSIPAEYVCIDPTAGAAVWKTITLT